MVPDFTESLVGQFDINGEIRCLIADGIHAESIAPRIRIPLWHVLLFIQDTSLIPYGRPGTRGHKFWICRAEQYVVFRRIKLSEKSDECVKL
jgi:hypothetical protein